jgi:hypothetical protein
MAAAQECLPHTGRAHLACTNKPAHTQQAQHAAPSAQHKNSSLHSLLDGEWDCVGACELIAAGVDNQDTKRLCHVPIERVGKERKARTGGGVRGRGMALIRPAGSPGNANIGGFSRTGSSTSIWRSRKSTVRVMSMARTRCACSPANHTVMAVQGFQALGFQACRAPLTTPAGASCASPPWTWPWS